MHVYIIIAAFSLCHGVFSTLIKFFFMFSFFFSACTTQVELSLLIFIINSLLFVNKFNLKETHTEALRDLQHCLNATTCIRKPRLTRLLATGAQSCSNSKRCTNTQTHKHTNTQTKLEFTPIHIHNRIAIHKCSTLHPSQFKSSHLHFFLFVVVFV